MNNKKNGLLYIIPTGKYANSTIDITKNERNIILPLIEGMPTHHCLIKNIYIGMDVFIIKRTFSWNDCPYMLGNINNIGRYDKSNWDDSDEIISKETNKKLDIGWGQQYGSRGRNVLDITKSRVNYYINISNLRKCKKIPISEIRDTCDHLGWWTTLKRWNFQSHIPHLQWGIINSSIFDLFNDSNSSTVHDLTTIITNNSEDSNIIKDNTVSNINIIEETNIIEKTNTTDITNDNIENNPSLTKNEHKKKKIILKDITIIKIPREKITCDKLILKSSEIYNLSQKTDDFNRNWDLPIIKLLATMDVWNSMTKTIMAPDNLMWGWRYFLGNAIAIKLESDNDNISEKFLDFSHIIDKSTQDIEESLRISKCKFKFSKIIISRMNHYSKVVKNHVKEIRESIQKTWNDQYKRDVKCKRELYNFMEEDESRWKIYIKERGNLNLSKNNIRYLSNQSYTEWINNNRNKLLEQLNSATSFDRFFNKSLLFINKSPLIRHVAFINYEKNPLKFEDESEKIVPFYIPLV
jgi:hypothetical protein